MSHYGRTATPETGRNGYGSTVADSTTPPSTPARFVLDVLNFLVLVTMLTLGVAKSDMCPVEESLPSCLIGEKVKCCWFPWKENGCSQRLEFRDCSS